MRLLISILVISLLTSCADCCPLKGVNVVYKEVPIQKLKIENVKGNSFDIKVNNGQ